MVEQWYYFTALLFSITGIGLLDWRYKLALWYDKKRTLIAAGISLLVFVIWDIAGITLGIFIHGDSRFSLPVLLLPEFPIEELFFLLLLCYVTLILFRAGEKIWPRI